ncbi:zinc dependent phospholipase C family protein [Flammeovirga sp. SubArs3]|uniref:zinc dependent phospholipase C family protein n=1 Tax=Flammeovirga sp. SubArs3 TaxID=2995316 RepID=UPI00248BFED7|nr:zinc dependent phospholipase C family protein [Flammeovirga sp. SubArs3]
MFILFINSLFWGFFGHQTINSQATMLLPDELFLFFKTHITDIQKGAIRPDQRRRLLDEEGAKHYIDVELYDSMFKQSPIYFDDALIKYSNDTLLKRGTSPWNIFMYKQMLTKAFQEKDPYKVIKYAAEVGHYYADLHVPLHTTENYNGQLSNQLGIHAFWETVLPERYYDEYSLQTHEPEYVTHFMDTLWSVMNESHDLVEVVLSEEKRISQLLPNQSKLVLRRRGASLQLLPTDEYALLYHEAVGEMVSDRMSLAIQRIANLWFTCWVDAGQPDLMELPYQPPKRKKKHKGI